MARHFSNEVLFLSNLDHPNIVKVIESANFIKMPVPNVLRTSKIDRNSFAANKVETEKDAQISAYDETAPLVKCSYLVMEYAEKGNLFDYICQQPLSEKATCFYFK